MLFAEAPLSPVGMLGAPLVPRDQGTRQRGIRSCFYSAHCIRPSRAAGRFRCTERLNRPEGQGQGDGVGAHGKMLVAFMVVDSSGNWLPMTCPRGGHLVRRHHCGHRGCSSPLFLPCSLPMAFGFSRFSQRKRRRDFSAQFATSLGQPIAQSKGASVPHSPQVVDGAEAESRPVPKGLDVDVDPLAFR